MGIIKRQSIKYSIVNYIGVIIGAISTLFIFPLVPDENGLIKFLEAAALLAIPFSSFGINGLVIRFFPEFKNEKNKNNGFLGLLTFLVLIGFGVVMLVAWFAQDIITSFYQEKPKEYLQFLPYALPLVLLISYANLLRLYISNFNRIVVPTIVYDIQKKFVYPVIVLLFYYGYISLEHMVLGTILLYLVINLSLLIYLKYLNQLSFKLSFSHLTKPLKAKMLTYATYGALGSLGSVIAFQLDIFMVGNISTLYNAGVYAMVLFIANTIDIPTRSIVNIMSPILSVAAKENDYDQIDELYKKSSLNLILAGGFIYLMIILNMDDFFGLLPNGDVLLQGKYVVIFLGIAKLVDQLTSVNGQIINYSPYFRFNFYAMLILGVLNIGLNIYLIPLYGINGAAMATMFSVIMYNILKLGYLYYKMSIHPFTMKTLSALILIIGSFLIIYLMPLTGLSIIDLALRVIILSGLFVGSILYFDISEDISGMIKEVWGKLVR